MTTSPGALSAPIRRWRRYVPCRFGQLHIVSSGPAGPAAPRPPLVCLHASPFSGDTFRDFQQLMATDRTVHCPDTPGYGNSDQPPVKPTITDYGAALAEAIGTLDFGDGRRQIDLFGDHTGALCAVEIAVQHPTLVRRVILSGVPHFDTDEARQAYRRQSVNIYPYFDDPDYVATFYRQSVLEAKGAAPPQRLLANFADRLRAGSRGWWGPDAVFSYDSGAALRRVQQPVLLLAFNEIMTQHTRDAARVLSHATVIEMPDLPIFGFMVDPARICTSMRNFLDDPD